MRTYVKLSVRAAALALGVCAAAGAASAQPADGHWNGGHWVADGHAFVAGDRVERGRWYRAQPADWRRLRLRRPPIGYQWRQIGSFYVLASTATGLVYETQPVGNGQVRVSAE